jgi:hypothetical protein
MEERTRRTCLDTVADYDSCQESGDLDELLKKQVTICMCRRDLESRPHYPTSCAIENFLLRSPRLQTSCEDSVSLLKKTTKWNS